MTKDTGVTTGMRDVIEQVAKNNNTTPSEVRHEIQLMIDSEWTHNVKMRKFFKTKPTPEEMILKSAMHIKADTDK